MSIPQKPIENNPQEKIERLTVPDNERMNALPRHFGVLSFVFEAKVYDWMEFLSKDYRGGYWHFYRLSNNGFYMAPSSVQSFHMANPGNGFDGELSADAAGIAACCYALSNLCFDYQTRSVFAERFHQLRDYVCEHAECSQILRLID